jgi:hypothetical protein
MPLILFLILVIMIAQIGFWDTFSAIIGGIAMILLFIVLLIAVLTLAGVLLTRRVGKRLR